MIWRNLTSTTQLGEILEKSKTDGNPIAIFKHSTRCSISSVVKSRIERGWKPETVPVYYLDLLSYREISNQVSNLLDIEHASPQLIIVKNGEVTYAASHQAINPTEAQLAV